MDKYLSVLTNFGCHYTCPYCIVNNTGIDIPKTTIEGLQNLPAMIAEHDCNWVSLSGGGDPLFDFPQHLDWWFKLMSVLPKGIKTELHTSYLSQHHFPYGQFDRVVFHLSYKGLIPLVERSSPTQIVRVVFVVTEDFTEEYINEIVRKVKENPNIDELSFRQMVDSNYEVTHYCEEYLKAGHKKDWWYIEQNDYNIYYAENKVSYKYEDFRKKKNKCQRLKK